MFDNSNIVFALTGIVKGIKICSTHHGQMVGDRGKKVWSNEGYQWLSRPKRYILIILVEVLILVFHEWGGWAIESPPGISDRSQYPT